MSKIPARPSENAHPIIHRLDLLRRAEDITIVELARRAKLAPYTVYGWYQGRSKNGRSPALDKIEQALAVFGYGLKVTPLKKP